MSTSNTFSLTSTSKPSHAFVNPTTRVATRAATQASSSASTSLAPSPCLDAALFPHIFEQIIAFASPPALASLRATSRAVQAIAERVLYRHVVVATAYPGVSDVVFLSPDQHRLPGLEADCPASLARRQHVRVLDIVRHPYDTEGRQSDAEWWRGMSPETVRIAGPRQLWEGYRAWDSEFWGKSYYTEFALYEYLAASLPPPPASKAVYFFDLVPPYPEDGKGDGGKIVPDSRFGSELRVGNRTASHASALVVCVQYEAGHPLLPVAEWWPCGDLDPALAHSTGATQVTMILVPTSVHPDAAAEPAVADFEAQFAAFAYSYFRPYFSGILWNAFYISLNLRSRREPDARRAGRAARRGPLGRVRAVAAAQGCSSSGSAISRARGTRPTRRLARSRAARSGAARSGAARLIPKTTPPYSSRGTSTVRGWARRCGYSRRASPGAVERAVVVHGEAIVMYLFAIMRHG